jgi:hypothetical protein
MPLFSVLPQCWAGPDWIDGYVTAEDTLVLPSSLFVSVAVSNQGERSQESWGSQELSLSTGGVVMVAERASVVWRACQW